MRILPGQIKDRMFEKTLQNDERSAYIWNKPNTKCFISTTHRKTTNM